MTLYLDVIWLLNWCFDCLLLYWTAILLKRKVKGWRIMIGGFIGSLIIILAFTPYQWLTGDLFVKLLFSFFMIITVFGFVRLRLFLKGLLLLYFITFLSGGVLLGLHYFFQFNPSALNSGFIQMTAGFGDPASWIFVLLGFPAAWYFSKRSIDNIEMASIAFDQLVTVAIKLKNCEWTVTGLVDSGNQLYDPISGSPVMILSVRGIEEDLPENVLRIIDDVDSFLSGDGSMDVEWDDRLRIIPCKVVGNDKGLLAAFKADSIRVHQENGILDATKSLISFTRQQLSPDEAYQAIVHPKMLTGTNIRTAS
ncbi:sigma-E processing peptidase SpoIIGA [Peribacillus saganii]|uniref:Sporulation sigma-E factor-processing peptidase n=1 Tax=Peribacillus saganii TaxID=2303992 RepID=A0A372LBG1_9BACI|nr:sigma-E processing peptidase SpoIIGA [Peribacillus saganii]RFU63189.1 sigma-E processing peptidase SpoIIGA [Peribacillus saganii]